MLARRGICVMKVRFAKDFDSMCFVYKRRFLCPQLGVSDKGLAPNRTPTARSPFAAPWCPQVLSRAPHARCAFLLDAMRRVNDALVLGRFLDTYTLCFAYQLRFLRAYLIEAELVRYRLGLQIGLLNLEHDYVAILSLLLFFLLRARSRRFVHQIAAISTCQEDLHGYLSAMKGCMNRRWRASRRHCLHYSAQWLLPLHKHYLGRNLDLIDYKQILPT